MRTLLFDFESTGLIDNTLKPLDKQPHAIEFYGMLIDNETFDIIDELDTLIKPPVTITAEITKITGITNDMVANAADFSVVGHEIEYFVERSNRLVAHNLSYDLQLMKFEYQRLGKTIKFPQLFCTVEQTNWIKGYRLSLTELYEYLFDEPFKGAHRAREDVQALFRCYQELIKRELI